MSTSTPSPPSPSLPLAVHVGFAGARQLWPQGMAPGPEAQQALETQLRAALTAIAPALGMSPQHFFVGISQMAVGADTLFTQACAALGWGQRVWLPQPREDYLSAVGTEGEDFSPVQRTHARGYLELPHIIEERVVSDAQERADRFDDTNLAILMAADVLVCLRREDQILRPGGTMQLMQRARARGVVMLELRLRWSDDHMPVLEQHWDMGIGPHFTPACLPAAIQLPRTVLALQPSHWPNLEDYMAALKEHSSARAKGGRSGFRWSAGVIVGTHLGATLLASLVLAHLVFTTSAWIMLALGAEVGLLAWGYWIHHQLHKARHTEGWAMARLCAEASRSTRALGRLHGSLAYLLALPFPLELRPVLRTMEVLHLRSLRTTPLLDWHSERERYITQRLTHPDRQQGQMAYYQREQAHAHALGHGATQVFAWMSVTAIVATASKLLMKLSGVDAGELGGWFGIVAVVFPVMAVGAMSMAAALDVQAREHTFAHMHDFLSAQTQQLQQATSQREAAALAVETETRLLGETVTWYARRAYTGIA